MRNLLGRLHARPSEELTRVAAFWQVPLGTDRHGHVGALYRALTDPRAARAAWDRLDLDERALVRLLALAEDEAPTLVELADRLGTPPDATREVAIRLYRAGILARQGDDDPLPIGEAPRLILPRELALLFRRVQDEIEAGDLSGTPLRALVELLDDAEIEEAAQVWGLTVIPGLRQRADLSQRVLRQVADPARVAAVAAGRRRDAAALWRRVRDEPGGAPVPLAAAAAGIGMADDDPRAGQRLRAALAELETALLVWHTYRPDGSRWLFVPTEIRSPALVPPAELPPLAPVTAGTLDVPAWRHPDALAWDLLTLLRATTAADAPPWERAADLPRGWLRWINEHLWCRGAETPPPGYLDLLLVLAGAEGLLRRDDNARTATGAGLRRWRDRAFADQSERLRRWWLDRGDWPEGEAGGTVEVWGADWRGARRRLLALLGDPALGLKVGVWYALDPVTARVAARDPDLLGPTFTAATARHGGDDGRAGAIAEVAGIALTGAFAWFGLVEVADIPGHARAVRVTAAGAALAGRTPLPLAADAGSGPALTVAADGEIALHAPTPLRVWSLSAFADPARLDRVSTYRLSRESLARALAAGFDLAQVVGFLAGQAGGPLPAEVTARLATWAHGYGRVRVGRAAVLTPDDPAALPDLLRVATAAGYPARPLGADALLVDLPPMGDHDDPEEALLALLRAAGHAPQAARPVANGALGAPSRMPE